MVEKWVDPHKIIKVFLPQKLFLSSRKYGSRNRILIFSPSRIQGSKRHRIPDPQNCFYLLYGQFFLVNENRISLQLDEAELVHNHQFFTRFETVGTFCRELCEPEFVFEIGSLLWVCVALKHCTSYNVNILDVILTRIWILGPVLKN